MIDRVLALQISIAHAIDLREENARTYRAIARHEEVS
jgi:hypothetical protein